MVREVSGVGWGRAQRVVRAGACRAVRGEALGAAGAMRGALAPRDDAWGHARPLPLPLPLATAALGQPPPPPRPAKNALLPYTGTSFRRTTPSGASPVAVVTIHLSSRKRFDLSGSVPPANLAASSSGANASATLAVRFSAPCRPGTTSTRSPSSPTIFTTASKLSAGSMGTAVAPASAAAYCSTRLSTSLPSHSPTLEPALTPSASMRPTA